MAFSVFTVVDQFWTLCVRLVTQSCPTLCNPMDWSLSGSSIHGILQEESWSGLPSLGNLPNPGIVPESLVSPALAGRFFTTEPPGKLPWRVYSPQKETPFLLVVTFPPNLPYPCPQSSPKQSLIYLIEELDWVDGVIVDNLIFSLKKKNYWSIVDLFIQHPVSFKYTTKWISYTYTHSFLDSFLTQVIADFPCGSAGKESACNVGDLSSIPELGRSPGEGKGYPLQYSGLENSTDCTVHGIAKGLTHWATFTSHRSLQSTE